MPHSTRQQPRRRTRRHDRGTAAGARQQQAVDLEEVNRIKKQVAELENIMSFAFSRSAAVPSSSSNSSSSAHSGARAAAAAAMGKKMPSAAVAKNHRDQRQRRRGIGGGGGGRSTNVSRNHGGVSGSGLPPEVEAEVQLPAIMLSRRTASAAAALTGTDESEWTGGRAARAPGTKFGLRSGALQDGKAMQYAITLDKQNQRLFESAAWRRQQSSSSEAKRKLSTAKILWPVLSPVVPEDTRRSGKANPDEMADIAGTTARQAYAPSHNRKKRQMRSPSVIDNEQNVTRARDGGVDVDDPATMEAEIDRIIQEQAKRDAADEAAAAAALSKPTRAVVSAKAAKLSAPLKAAPRGQGACGNRKLVGRHRKFTVKVQAPIDQKKHIVPGVPLYCYDKLRQWEQLIQPGTKQYDTMLEAIRSKGIHFKLFYKAYVDPATRKLRILYKNNCSPEPW
eukprot:INCI17202.3.p2 GENE.INCI17202.3~~INCI17202.3.p2  ORF type:complete len:451 (+),score=69.37 INCI17202.3:242-1594(+)